MYKGISSFQSYRNQNLGSVPLIENLSITLAPIPTVTMPATFLSSRKEIRAGYSSSKKFSLGNIPVIFDIDVQDFLIDYLVYEP